MTVLNRAEDVAAELRTRLLTLTIAQGAETDIGRKVFQGRRKVDDSMLPCVSMIEGDDVPARETNTTTYELAQRYVLFAYLLATPTTPTSRRTRRFATSSGQCSPQGAGPASRGAARSRVWSTSAATSAPALTARRSSWLRSRLP